MTIVYHCPDHCPDGVGWCENHQLLNGGWKRHDLTEPERVGAMVREVSDNGLLRGHNERIELLVRASGMRAPDGIWHGRVWVSYGFHGSFEMVPSAARTLGSALIDAAEKVAQHPRVWVTP